MVLAIVFLPAGFNLFPFQQSLTTFLFGSLVEIGVPYHFNFISDAAALYVLMVKLGVIALLIGATLRMSKVESPHVKTGFHWIRLLAIYYLSSRLLVYGFDKIFQAQFYWPEPNTLYTPLGYLEKDILYWSAVGTSYWYSMLVGIAEVIPAILLWFRRTRLIGLLLSLVALVHVLFINMGFDISVKLFVVFLLWLTIWLIGPNWGTLAAFFLQKKSVSKVDTAAPISIALPWRNGLKVLMIGLLMIEAMWLPLQTGYWNDNHIPRPLFHGAYQVEQPAPSFGINADSSALPIRFFIHRRHFFIVQYDNDHMLDFALQIDTAKRQFRLVSTAEQALSLDYQWNPTDSMLSISRKMGDTTVTWHGHGLNWRNLPALQDQFHWTIDE